MVREKERERWRKGQTEGAIEIERETERKKRQGTEEKKKYCFFFGARE